MVLRRPLQASIPILAYITKNTVHGANRTQVLILLQQALVHFCWRLITIRCAVQYLYDGSTLLGTQSARLHRLLT